MSELPNSVIVRICLSDGQCVEYTGSPTSLSSAFDGDGNLDFNCTLEETSKSTYTPINAT